MKKRNNCFVSLFIITRKRLCIILRVMTDYTVIRKIASYEVNLYGELRLSTILRICQEVAEEHLIGFGMDHVTLMQTQNLAFLILRVGMKINRMPRDGETIIIRTQPEGNSGAQFYRPTKYVLMVKS